MEVHAPISIAEVAVIQDNLNLYLQTMATYS